jgi:hypothetical protein
MPRRPTMNKTLHNRSTLPIILNIGSIGILRMRTVENEHRKLIKNHKNPITPEVTRMIRTGINRTATKKALTETGTPR